jgi:Zn-dependent protease
MFQTLYVGKLAGIRLYIHWTFWWLLIYVFLSQIGAGLSQTLGLIGFVLAVFGCVFLHELGHAFSGRWFGVQTQDITMMPIGGLARMGTPHTPLAELVIAACGPLVNVVIAIVLALGFAVKANWGGPIELGNMGFVEQLLVANVGLVIFNLLPVYPMDGGRIVRAILKFFVPSEKAVYWTARLGQILAAAFFLYGLFYSWQIAFIFAIMFVVCSAEIFQAKVKKAFMEGQFPKGYSPNTTAQPQTGPFGGFGGFDSRNASEDGDGEIIDAEEVRRVQ